MKPCLMCVPLPKEFALHLLNTIPAIPKMKFSSPLLGLMGPADLPPHPSTLTFLLLQGQRLLGMVGNSEPGHSSRSPGLRPKGSTEDKANISLNFISSKLNWETKEEKLNRVGVPAPELSSAEAAFLLHSFALWLLCKQFSGCVFLAQSTESCDSQL